MRVNASCVCLSFHRLQPVNLTQCTSVEPSGCDVTGGVSVNRRSVGWVIIRLVRDTMKIVVIRQGRGVISSGLTN